MKWFICLIFGHKWQRFGYPTKDDVHLRKDDIQLFLCLRCAAMPTVEHNGLLPRKAKPIIDKNCKKG